MAWQMRSGWTRQLTFLSNLNNGMEQTKDMEKHRASLCDQCVYLFEVIESKEKDLIEPFHENRTALKHSQDSGCSICSTLWKGSDMPWEGSAHFEGSEHFLGSDRVIIARAAKCIDLRFESSHGGWNSTVTHIREFVLCRVEDDEDFLSRFLEDMLEDESDSAASLNLAAALLGRCISFHVDCVPSFQPPTYPSRLLDV
jgi:hypothetical protein